MDESAPSAAKKRKVTIKTDPSTTSNQFDDEILEIIRRYSTDPATASVGVSNDQLTTATAATMTPIDRGAVVNRLLAAGLVEMLRTGGASSSAFTLRLRNQTNADKIRGATVEETLAYGLIEDAERRGIWKRDVRLRSGLSETQVNKALKGLEKRKLVKLVKGIGAEKKPVYMLYELEPDAALTGGAFYSEQKFDSEFAHLLNEQCLKFLRARRQLAIDHHPTNLAAQRTMSFMCSTDVWQHINDLQISRQELSIKDVERVLDSVVFDGHAERTHHNDRYAMYRAKKHPTPNGLTRLPCTFCPVAKDCAPGRVISPANCLYFNEWLSDL